MEYTVEPRYNETSMYYNEVLGITKYILHPLWKRTLIDITKSRYSEPFCLSLGPSLYLGSTVFDVLASSFPLEFKKWKKKLKMEEKKN